MLSDHPLFHDRGPDLDPVRIRAWTAGLLDRAVRGKAVIRDAANQVVSMELRTDMQQAFRVAKAARYVIVRGKQSEPLANAWSAWCNLNGLPIVRVRAKTRFARIDLDLSVWPEVHVGAGRYGRLKPEGAEAIKELLSSVGNEEFFAGKLRAWHERVPAEDVPRIASELVRLALEFRAEPVAEAMSQTGT
jgi:hypothetical protein